MRYPLIAPLVAVAAGICLERFSAWQALPAAIGVGAFLLLGAIAVRFARRLAPYCLLCALILVGILLARSRHPGKAPVIEAAADETVLLEGCVVEPSVFSDGRDQFILEVARNARARVTVAIREGQTPPDLSYGQRVSLEARVRAPRNFENPGAFDYRGFLARQHVYWNASMHPGTVPKLLPGPCGSRSLAIVYEVRQGIMRRLDALYASDPMARGLLEAILLGERRKLDKVWQDDFRRAGTYHVLVIAGLHLAAFTSFLLLMMRLFFVRVIPALVVTAAAAWFYVLLAGGSTPVLRAAGGFTLYLVARYFSRRGRLLNLLAAVALIFLIRDPGQLFEAGFQLSFLAVASIGALGAPWIEATSGPYLTGLRDITEASRDPRLPPCVAEFRLELRLIAETIGLYTRIPVTWSQRFLALALRLTLMAWELILISAAMQIGLALPMALYFHRVSLSGISANVFVVPLMSFVVPAGFLAVATMWRPIAAVAAWLVETAARVSMWHAHAGPDWRIPDPPLWLSLAFVASVLVLAFVLGHEQWKHARAAAGCAVLALFVLIVWHPFPPLMNPGTLEFTALDVGQGDSLLVGFPDRRLLLVDGGGIPTFRGAPKSRLDIGEDVVAPYLWYRSIRRLDVIALTHAHADHAGGIPALIEDFRPRELWTGANSGNPAWRAVRDTALKYGVRIRPLHAGERFNIGGAAVSVLAPSADYSPGDTPGNNDSLVLRVQYKERSFLLTGDAESPVEARMLADGLAAKVDVLKVAHHGSKTSTSEAFLDATKPAFAAISDGEGNLFHHPYPGTLAHLLERHVDIHRTDREGLISFFTDGHRIWLETFARDARLSLLPP